MHAVTIPQAGGPDVLTWAEVADLRPGPGEVLIHVAAAGVNRADCLQRQGHYPPPAGTSLVPGLECSGTVAEIGPGVTGWHVGDEVCALLAGGGYAEQVVVPATQVLPRPDGVSLVEAAALPEAACTVWSTVISGAGLRAGQTLLVHGGASGIGTTAIQLGVAVGAQVAVTAGSTAKLQRCQELGAQILVNYREEDFVDVVHAATGGRGADVVLDIIGAAYLARNLAVLAPDGRLAVIGLQRGTRADLDLGALLAKRGTIMATSLRSRPSEQKAAIVAEVRERVWPLVAQGRLRPVIDRVLPMTQASEAHRVMEASEHVGKILLTPAAQAGGPSAPSR